MARGKYSPTVSAAYAADQSWWTKYAVPANPDDFVMYDPDGYDSYGYNKDDVDRAGNHENDYLHNDGDYNQDEDFNSAYESALWTWGFDGTKPVNS